MSNLIKSFLVSLMVLMSTNLFAGVVTVNGEACGVLTGSLTVDATGNIILNTDGNCGAPTFDLSVTSSGYGEISSDIGGLLVRKTTKSQSYLSTQTVVLTATPDDGEDFNGWTNCPSAAVSPDTCTLDMSSAQAVTGTFTTNNAPTTYSLTVEVGGTGQGNVSSSPSGINSCTATGGTCAASSFSGEVTLTAYPSGSDTVTWSGCANTSGTVCTAPATTATVSATFTASTGGNYPSFVWPSIKQKTISLKGSKVITYQIKTTNTTKLGGQLSTAFTTGTSANRLVTISTSPGDFNMQALGKCAASGSETASVAWTQNPKPPFPYNIIGICILKPSTTYYINVKHTNCASSSTCSFHLSN